MQQKTILIVSLVCLLLEPKTALSQVTTNPFSINEELWLIKKGISLHKYTWGTNVYFQTELYSILNHRKQSRIFFSTSVVGVFSAIYVSNNSEGFFYQVFMVPLGATSLIHFIIGRHKIKKLRKKF